MKKALALVLALVLALSMAVSAFALDIVELVPAETKASDKVTIKVVDIADEEKILYTNPILDDILEGKIGWGTEYYVALSDAEWEDVKVTANGNVTAELVEYKPATMDLDGIDVRFEVADKAGNVVGVWTADNDGFATDYEAYAAAKKYAEELNKAEKALMYDVEVTTNVNIIKIVVENNFSAHYTEGTIKVEATLDGDAYVGSVKFINDVTIFEYEEVKYAAEKNAKGAYLQLGAGGYSDYETAKAGYNLDTVLGYDKDLLRETPAALVVSTTAFRAIEGKDLTLAIIPALNLRGNDKIKETEVSVTLKDIVAGQKGVNFFASLEVEGIDLEGLEDRYPTAITLEFLGNQVIKGEYEVKIALPINYYELRELFGIKVEEDDIISYYVVDENGKVVGGKEVDYMTANLNETVEFTATGANKALGSYTICLEVPAAEEGEANPNTGAESVVGVVAALAVVSVATAAAVSLKK